MVKTAKMIAKSEDHVFESYRERKVNFLKFYLILKKLYVRKL